MSDDEEIVCQARKYLDLALGGNARMYESGLAAIGYFDAPASSGRHLAVRGGLVRHSLNVTRRLVALTGAWGVCWPRPESPYLVGMLHDLVKCRCYKPVTGPAQIGPQKYEYTQPEYPGHGTCSVAIAAELGIHWNTSRIAMRKDSRRNDA